MSPTADSAPVTDRPTVLIVDDRPENLLALEAVIEPLDITVVRADSGEDALRRLLTDEVAVIILDVQMPGLDGIEATRRLLAAHPGTGVVVLTMSEEDGTLVDALRAGARGYLLKGAEPDEVVRAITTVAGGGVVFGAVLAGRVADFLAQGASGAGRAEEVFGMLTVREREVLDLVAAGLSNGQIAARLYLSQKTVRNHVHAILSKLPAVDRAEAIIRARDAGLGR